MKGLVHEAVDTFQYKEHEPSLKRFQLLKCIQMHSVERKQQHFRASGMHVDLQWGLS